MANLRTRLFDLRKGPGFLFIRAVGAIVKTARADGSPPLRNFRSGHSSCHQRDAKKGRAAFPPRRRIR